MSVDSLVEVDWKMEFEKLKIKYEANKLTLYQMQTASQNELAILLAAERKKINQLTVKLSKTKCNEPKTSLEASKSNESHHSALDDELNFKRKYLLAANELQQTRAELAKLANKVAPCKIEKKKSRPKPRGNPTTSVIVVDNCRVHELELMISNQRKELEEQHRIKLALKSRCEVVESQLADRRKDIEMLLEKNELNNEIIMMQQRLFLNCMCVRYKKISTLTV